MDTQYQLIDAVIKSRLLSYDDEGYEELLGMDVDSFRKRYRDASDEKLKPILRRFETEFINFDAAGPTYMLDAYIRASDVYNSVDFDWGKNKQMASRKKFCLWMFRQAYLNNSNLHDDPYTPTKDDRDLFGLFKPEMDSKSEAIDIVFTLLLTFQVIRPFGSDSQRALKYASPVTCRERMVELLKTLRNELPVAGITKDLHSIQEGLDLLTDPDIETDFLPPAALWGILNNISFDLQMNSSPERLLNNHVELTGYSMHGIWVDDAPDKPKRFWIFPDNRLMAFCYYRKNDEWLLQPYEFGFYRQEGEEELEDTCVIATVRGNTQILMGQKIDEQELARLTYELTDCDEEGRFQTITFEPEIGTEYPYWMIWRGYHRLPEDHPLAEEYMSVVKQIYGMPEMLRGFSFRNLAPWLTDVYNSLIGLDSDFLYLVDIATGRTGGTLVTESEEEAYPLFIYYVDTASPEAAFNLFAVDISREQPLYVLPRDSEFFERLDKRIYSRAMVDAFPNPAERNAFRRRYEDFKETVMATQIKHQVTIHRNIRQSSPDMLCFNQISRTFALKELLEWFGVRKFTSREEMLTSDIFRWRSRMK